jgi:Lon protease-like protein
MKAPLVVLLVLALNPLDHPLTSTAAERFFISVPVLVITNQDGKTAGASHSVAIQLDRLPQPSGPEVQFNEGSRALGRIVGSALSSDWKEAARVAVQAASRALAEDPRLWRITIKNLSPAYLTDGPSAGGVLAVGILAAMSGKTLLPGTAMTGAIETSGLILPVGGLPEKIQGAALIGITTILIPKGQGRTLEWDIWPLAEQLRLIVIEVHTLAEAYEKMTGYALPPI